MPKNYFDSSLLEAAEQMDKKLHPERIAQLKKSYAFFKESGLSDDEIKVVMSLTLHEMRLIRQSKR